MSRRYPPEVHEFIRSHVEGVTCAELAKITNEACGTDFDEVRMHAYKHNHHLKSGTKTGKPKGWSPIYPEDMADYMRSIAEGKNVHQIADLINEHYGRHIIGPMQVRAYKKNHGIVSNLDTRFQKGQEPYTKGKKQSEYMSPEAIERTKATRFQAGQAPANLLQVGAVVKNTEGYLLRKKQMEGTQWERWEFLHRAVWEEHNGPIPESMMVSFKDGNKENCDISNLMLITNAENLELHRSGLRFEDPDLTETGLNIVKLKIRARERKHEQRRLQGPDGGEGHREGHERGEAKA
ncbi:HNH endonuclease signature motif containing protein [Gemmiger sp.]